MELRKANRKQSKIKMALQGPSGSGKTYSSLLLAYGLAGSWNKVAIIDTENFSADLYSHVGDYNVLPLLKPFAPENYITAIEACENSGIEVIILDSISHEWDGQGGILEIHGNMIGNSFTNWNQVTPRHNKFVQKILQSPCHIIATIRSKQDYVLSEKNGKMVPEKVGLKGITRDGMDYEFTIVLDIDIKHNALASKDRTGLFMDRLPFMITKATGEKIRSWCLNCDTLTQVQEKIAQATTVEELRQILKTYPEYRGSIESLCIERKNQLAAISQE